LSARKEGKLNKKEKRKKKKKESFERREVQGVFFLLYFNSRVSPSLSYWRDVCL
jgi:hypothetical protein